MSIYAGSASNEANSVATAKVYANGFLYDKDYTLPYDKGNGESYFTSASIYEHLNNLYKRIAYVKTIADQGVTDALAAATVASAAAETASDAAKTASAAAETANWDTIKGKPTEFTPKPHRHKTVGMHFNESLTNAYVRGILD